MLWEQKSPEIVSIPTNSVAFGRVAGLGAFLTEKQVESQAAKDGQVVLRTSALGADARISFVVDRLSVSWVTDLLSRVLDESL